MRPEWRDEASAIGRSGVAAEPSRARPSAGDRPDEAERADAEGRRDAVHAGVTPERLGTAAGARCPSAIDADTGRLLASRVVVAATRAARRRGLLGRDRLEPGEALWIVPSRGVHTGGMRFPIDVVALDRRGVVVDLVERLAPWRIRLPRRGTFGVLELAAGTLAASRTRIGHRVVFM